LGWLKIFFSKVRNGAKQIEMERNGVKIGEELNHGWTPMGNLQGPTDQASRE
jgi:hypothetical protein